MNNPFCFEIQRSQPFPLTSWAGQNEYEATACGPFTAVSMENPGGGRIKNKKIPTGIAPTNPRGKVLVAW